MIDGIGATVNLNQENQHAVQAQAESAQKMTADVVEGKVNPVESPDNLYDESGSNEEANSQDVLNPGSCEGRIVELVG
ncbi:MAG: hypothetical protein IMF18_05160 [Proteobacteria bacterium]|nr:hypothetical protein [Pseudomonadota bacterium]